MQGAVQHWQQSGNLGRTTDSNPTSTVGANLTPPLLPPDLPVCST